MPATSAPRGCAGLLAAAALCAPLAALAVVDPAAAVAPRMEFSPPLPGSYTLQRIQPVAPATLFGPSGRPTRLSTLTRGKITLLTFFYTYCADPLGCPFAHQTLAAIRDELQRDAGLTARVRFVSISLDPTTDTPAAIGRYLQLASQGSALEWDALTAGSVRDLLPVLDDRSPSRR